MAAFIPNETLDQILDKCDIAEIISSYLPLKKAGRNYRALCPFHHEKTPSFVVNTEKGIYHCFGCGSGGNAFSFIMKYERLEFPEVVKILAKKTGVLLPEGHSRGFGKTISDVETQHKIHEFAAAYFQNMLVAATGRRAQEYLINRGIGSEITRKFRLGFAPDFQEGLFIYLKGKGFSKELIEKSGLIIRRPDGSGYYDRFRNRLMFPIFNQRDKIIAFAGRVLGDSRPKYINSPETPIYNKSRTLFGLNFAKKAINEKDAAVIVEGYTDLLIPYQGGIRNIIASCGTAITPDHIRLLRRHSRNVIMVYDSDKAGELAILRGLDLLLADDMHVGVAPLPKGFDPDTFVRKYGIEAFQKLLMKPVGLLDYKLNILKSIYGSDHAESKARVADEMLKTISKIGNAILKSEYLKRLAESLKVDESGLMVELNKIKKVYTNTHTIKTPEPESEVISLAAADKIIIGVMIEDNTLIPFVRKKLGCHEFCNNISKQIVDLIFRFNAQSRPVSYSTLMNHLEAKGLDTILAEIAAKQSAFANRHKNLDDCILWIKKNNMKANLDRLRREIKDAQGFGQQQKAAELAMCYNRLIKECTRAGSCKQSAH